MHAQACLFAVRVPMARGQMPNGSPGVFIFGVKKKKDPYEVKPTNVVQVFTMLQRVKVQLCLPKEKKMIYKTQMKRGRLL